MNKTFKKVFSVCCAVVTTLTATLFHSANLKAEGQTQKIVFVGPSATGKTNLVSRICNNSYSSDYKPTKAANYTKTSQISIWDTGDHSNHPQLMDTYFKDAHLCVLSISNTNQETEYFLNKIAENNVPNVVLCITKTEEGTPTSEEVSSLLDTVKNALTGVKVFDEVLYTSAKENKFKFCTPDKFDSTNPTLIHGLRHDDTVLAQKLYELCGDKAADSRAEIYEGETSYGESIKYDSLIEKPTTSNGRKYALGFGIPAGLLTLIFGTAYYEYDRHFRKQEKTQTKPNPALSLPSKSKYQVDKLTA